MTEKGKGASRGKKTDGRRTENDRGGNNKTCGHKRRFKKEWPTVCPFCRFYRATRPRRMGMRDRRGAPVKHGSM